VAKNHTHATAKYESMKRGRTFEVIADLLREKIFSGEYQPGERLPTEREMAEMIEVSRSAVREAYHALEMLDIVEIRKGTDGGTFIREPTRRTITQTINDLVRLKYINLKDMAEARLYLEKDLVELAVARVTADDLGQLRTFVERAGAKVEAGVAAHEENVEFHLCLSRIAGNPLLAMVYASVMDLFLLILKSIPAEFEASRTIAEEHSHIIALLKAKKLKALMDFVDKHIKGSNERLVRLCQGKNIPWLAIGNDDASRAA